MKRCCDNPEKYFLEFRKRNDNELFWFVCQEYFQNEEYRKMLEEFSLSQINMELYFTL